MISYVVLQNLAVKVIRMDICRHVDYGDVADSRVRECLDKLEAAKRFMKGVDLGTPVVPGLTIQNMILALVSAEQALSVEEQPEAIT